MFVDWAGYLIVDSKYDEDKNISTVDVRFYAGNNNLYIGTQRLNRETLIQSIDNLYPIGLKYYAIDTGEKTSEIVKNFENVSIPVLKLDNVFILTVDGQKYIKNDNSTDAHDSLK
ncbi:hypothetical protein KIJ05_00590 [Leuconostoc gelidum subsp. gasicomitatum]|uniref:hypothetical protein n=1 Tax=Leuconostoc gasicomitatum TaxID=115778 RepID=UPI001CC66C2F|nr:hypothetical protein [Leuconostoc gasicomitatum]MBZ5983640.1 hypothetical protein [Leuconostoc gasicomitatum]